MIKKRFLVLLIIAFLAVSFFGVRSIITRNSEPVTATVDKESATLYDSKRLLVPLICQYPELPTGCEATATTMVLQFYGEDISAEEFAESWLDKNSDFYTYGGIDFGPDPNLNFVGDPFTSYGYGCYAPVIVKAVNSNSATCKAEAFFGKDLDSLCKEYVDNGKPMLIWASIDMKKTKEGTSWQLPDGERFTWISGEHCLVLVGYDEKNYYLNDPLTGTVVSYKKQLVKDRYSELGKQAVYISKGTSPKR